MSVKMKDVAAHAGVSTATVSNVFTGNHYVSPEVKERVLRSVEELNYHLNLSARNLKTATTMTIGVVLPDITKLFFTEVMRGILEEADRYNYKIVVLSSYFDFSKEKECISYLRSSNVDAIIVDTCCDYHDLRAWAEELASYKGRYVPVTFIESCVDGGFASSIRIDIYYWAGKMTKYLYSLGKKQILYLGGLSHLPQEHEMLTGFRQAAADCRISCGKEYIKNSDYTSESAYEIITKAIRDGLPFDAVQASNDEAAVGVLKALNENSIPVPEKVALTGFDNLFPTTFVDHAITTVNVPRHEIGVTAVSECIHHIVDPSLPHRNIVLGGEIIRRNSTEPGIITPWELNYW